jgi:5-methyltetrahydrofolate--homocysteine methyltransferase
LENGKDTAWFIPLYIIEISRLNFKYAEQNIWFNRLRDLIKSCHERWNGLVQIGMTDLGGNLDILSTFRPSENLIFDLCDHPEQVKRLTWEAHQTWWTYFEKLNALYQPLNPGYTCWTPIFSEAPYYMLQCDFSYMIRPKMFAEFVLPELAASADRLGNAFYHLDGPGQLPHLDLLLEVDSIKGVQWVPGSGAPDVSHWQEVYRKIFQAGKLTQIFHGQYQGGFDLLDILMDQVGSVENVCYIIDGDISQEKEIMAKLQKYRVL